MRRLLASGSVYADVTPIGVEIRCQGVQGVYLELSQAELEALVELALEKNLLDPQWLSDLAQEAGVDVWVPAGYDEDEDEGD